MASVAGGGVVQIVVAEPFPQSTDERIKVALIEPDPKRVQPASAAAPVGGASSGAAPAAGAVAAVTAFAGKGQPQAAVAASASATATADVESIRFTDTGALQWTAMVAPSATLTVTVKYTVTTPAGTTVNGLPFGAGL